ncbi:MAG TPA: hypothetical protein DCL21_04025 [Alphaproteobacteria bacterium]|nr:hypothetical protein [Alphaproteobacteria bacterium]
MKLKLMAISFALMSLNACTSATTAHNINEIKFEFKDPLEKYTSIIYSHQFYDDAVNSPKIVQTCKIEEGGTSEDDFEYFKYYNLTEFRKCLNMLMKYKDHRFKQEGTNDKAAYEAFMARKDFYQRYYFSLEPQS